MNRRTFLKASAATAALALTPFELFADTRPDIEGMIRVRIAERLTVADYLQFVRCVRQPERERPLREAFEKFPDFAKLMEPIRVRGLVRLLEAELPDEVKGLLLNLRIDDVMHEVGTCLDHFLGVYQLLRGWGRCPEDAYIGLFHAIYGTEFNPITVLDARRAEDRAKLSDIIGARSERWVRAYGYVDSDRFIAAVGLRTFTIGDLTLAEREFPVLADALVANTFEPFIADGEKARLGQLRQFRPLDRYLSAGARRAIGLAE